MKAQIRWIVILGLVFFSSMQDHSGWINWFSGFDLTQTRTCDAIPPWRRPLPGCAWGGLPTATPPWWPSPSSAPPPSPPSAAAFSSSALDLPASLNVFFLFSIEQCERRGCLGSRPILMREREAGALGGELLRDPLGREFLQDGRFLFGTSGHAHACY